MKEVRRKKTKWQILLGSAWEWSAALVHACGPTSGTDAELSSAIRDAASLFAFIFFALPAAERLRDTM